MEGEANICQEQVTLRLHAHRSGACRRMHQGHIHIPSLVLCEEPITLSRIPVPQTLCMAQARVPPLPISAGVFPVFQAANPRGVCRQHKLLTSLLAEIKPSSQLIIFSVSPIT